MYRTLIGLVGTLLGALVLVGLTFSRSVDPPAQFRFVNATDPKTLDPHLATGEPEHRILDALFEGLTRHDPRSLEIIGGVAESWQLSQDATRYTFTLRPQARWSDGRELSAHDFVYSWLRILSPETGAEYAYILHVVKHAEAFNTFEARAAALRGPVTKAFATLLEGGGDVVDAAVAQRVLVEADAQGALSASRDGRLLSILSKRSGELSKLDLRYAASRLEPEARALDAALAEAHAHFGKDQGVYAPDPHTLIVELRAPTPYFLELTAFYPTFPVPRHVVEAVGNARDWFLPQKIVANGAYRLQRWTVNDRIRLLRSETYWDRANVRTETIEALPVENAATALNLYLTEEVQWLPGLYPLELVHRFKSRPDFYVGPGMTVYYYRFNCERGPLRDRRVRQALSLAVDRKLIVEEVLGLGQQPAYHMVPPGMPGYTSPQSALSYDPARAAELLAEAGYPKGEGLPELGIVFNTHEAHKKIAEVIADQLQKNLGVRVVAYNQEWQSYLATVRSGGYDIARAGWVGDYLDPNTFLDQWVTNGGNNQTGFSSAPYDTLLRAAADMGRTLAAPELVTQVLHDAPGFERQLAELRRTTDLQQRQALTEALRMRLLSEAERILVAEEFPIMPLYFYVQSGFIAPRVEGFYSRLQLSDGTEAPNLQDLHPLRALSVRQP